MAHGSLVGDIDFTFEENEKITKYGARTGYAVDTIYMETSKSQKVEVTTGKTNVRFENLGDGHVIGFGGCLGPSLRAIMIYTINDKGDIKSHSIQGHREQPSQLQDLNKNFRLMDMLPKKVYITDGYWGGIKCLNRIFMEYHDYDRHKTIKNWDSYSVPSSKPCLVDRDNKINYTKVYAGDILDGLTLKSEKDEAVHGGGYGGSQNQIDLKGQFIVGFYLYTSGNDCKGVGFYTITEQTYNYIPRRPYILIKEKLKRDPSILDKQRKSDPQLFELWNLIIEAPNNHFKHIISYI